MKAKNRPESRSQRTRRRRQQPSGVPRPVVTRLDPFVAALPPALFILGELTFAALVRNTIENLVLLGQMQRIRGYYRSLVPEASQFFDPPETNAQFQAVLGTVGLRTSPGQRLFTGPVWSAQSTASWAGSAWLCWRHGSPLWRMGRC